MNIDDSTAGEYAIVCGCHRPNSVIDTYDSLASAVEAARSMDTQHLRTDLEVLMNVEASGWSTVSLVRRAECAGWHVAACSSAEPWYVLARVSVADIVKWTRTAVAKVRKENPCPRWITRVLWRRLEVWGGSLAEICEIAKDATQDFVAIQHATAFHPQALARMAEQPTPDPASKLALEIMESEPDWNQRPGGSSAYWIARRALTATSGAPLLGDPEWGAIPHSKP